MTRDLPGTKGLFAKLFRWTYSEQPPPSGGVTLVHCGEHIVGALHALPREQDGARTTPHWGVHIMVGSADDVAQTAQSHGARLVAPPTDVGENGRFCAFADPSGAVLCCWQPKRGQGMTGDGRQHGMPSRIELMTNQTELCAAFYRTVFGWTAATRSMDSGATYTVFRTATRAAAGMLAIPRDESHVPPHWSCYVTVEDIAYTMQEAERGGAKILVEHDIQGVGRFAVMRTRDGVIFKAITWAESALAW